MQCIRFPCMHLQEFADCPAQSGMLSLQETTDIFLNFTVSGLLEIPAYLAALLILRRWGRRSALIGGAWSRDLNAPL